MNKIKVFTFLSLFLLFSSQVHAGEWVRGKVSGITLNNQQTGSFTITFDNNSIDDCFNNSIFIGTQKLGLTRVERAYRLAITSLTSGAEFGVLLDKSNHEFGGWCSAHSLIELKIVAPIQ